MKASKPRQMTSQIIMGMLVLFAAVVMATGYLAAVPPVAPATAPATDPDERQYPVPYITTLKYGNETLNVWPQKPSSTYKGAEGFVYQLPAVIGVGNASNLFTVGDNGAVTFRFDLRLPDIEVQDSQAILAAKRGILNYYKQHGVIDKPDVNEIVLLPKGVKSFSVTARHGQQTVVLRSDGPFGDPVIRQNIGVFATLTDPKLAEALRKAPDQLEVYFNGVYLVRGAGIVRISAELQQEIIKGFKEDINFVRRELVLDRKAEQVAKRLLGSRVRLVIEQSANLALNDAIVSLQSLVLSSLEKRIEAISLDSIKDENVFVYTANDMRLELSPNHYRNLTTHLTEKEDAESHFKDFNQQLYEFANKMQSIDKFHQDLRSLTKIDARLSGKFGFAVEAVPITGESSGKYSTYVEKERLTDTEKQHLEELREYLKSENQSERDIRSSRMVDWTGENLTERYDRKDYGLSRLTNDDLHQIIAASAEIVQPAPKWDEVEIPTRAQLSGLPVSTVVHGDVAIGGVMSGAVPVGTVLPFAGNPSSETERHLAQHGWVYARGQRVKYGVLPDLEERIGRAHGGADDYFLLPDYGALFLRGFDWNNVNRDESNKRKPAAFGGSGGNTVGSREDDEVKAHRHQTSGFTRSTLLFKNDRSTDYLTIPEPRIMQNFGFLTENSSLELTAEGGAETRPKNNAVDYIIKISDHFIEIDRLREMELLKYQESPARD